MSISAGCACFIAARAGSVDGVAVGRCVGVEGTVGISAVGVREGADVGVGRNVGVGVGAAVWVGEGVGVGLAVGVDEGLVVAVEVGCDGVSMGPCALSVGVGVDISAPKN
jgi:hypothetical protein